MTDFFTIWDLKCTLNNRFEKGEQGRDFRQGTGRAIALLSVTVDLSVDFGSQDLCRHNSKTPNDLCPHNIFSLECGENMLSNSCDLSCYRAKGIFADAIKVGNQLIWG